MKRFKYHIVFLISLIVINFYTYSQAKYPDANIVISGNKILYSDNLNIIVVSSQKDSIQNLIIKSSQGSLHNPDSPAINGMFFLSGLKNGIVTINVFSKTDTNLTLINNKIFSVVTKPLSPDEKKLLKLKIKPIIFLEGYSPGKISIKIAEKAKRFSINKPYKIKKITAYFGGGVGSDMMLTVLNSEEFDSYFLKIWERILPGTRILLDIVEITDDKGNTYKFSPGTYFIAE